MTCTGAARAAAGVAIVSVSAGPAAMVVAGAAAGLKTTRYERPDSNGTIGVKRMVPPSTA